MKKSLLASLAYRTAGSIKNDYLILLALSWLVLQFQGATLAAAPEVQGSADIRNAGEIIGVVQFCGGALSSNGTHVDLPSHSFSAETGSSGMFTLRYVPQGVYTLRIRVPGQPEFTQAVQVSKGQVTDVGTINRCDDSDGDGYTPDLDCNDNNALINPAATEICDGIDNNCDGTVDGPGCTACTDADNDGFKAQAGCGTPVDCNDADNTIRPNAAEICDGLDNNCDGQADEGFDLLTDPNNCGACGNVCTTTCELGQCSSVCGNGMVEPPEQCDDGNLINGDGCQNDCTTAALCDPLNPEPICGTDNGCHATPTGVPFCAPAGIGMQGDLCLSSLECAQNFTCVTIVDQDTQCLAWCTSDADCTAPDTCVLQGQAFVGEQEYGFCFDL